ncbi:GbsR/MarR family transcriptional regulator [Pontibacter indicus]|uniref:HTH-type transcriptional regulator n=1 Tax=Pontibacter indicus TaxID=1317125 RepID=A0A1R3XD17_9BACT|nr:DNA-binding transcriptional regulator GbsR, MarR family [Pontibacter indicus]
MQYSEAKERYIEAWGSLGSSWGVNRTMAQIHALLMIATEPLTTENIMEELKISRGNANMNLRALLDWGLAKKVLKPGERKEYFVTDKDPMVLATQVAKERKKRELDPIIKLLEEVSTVQGGNEEAKEFRKVTADLKGFAKQADSVLNTFIQSNANWFFKILGKLTR